MTVFPSAAQRRPTQKSAYLFIAPIAIGFAVFYIWPLIQTFAYSFTEFGPFGGNTFTGLQNYDRAASDPGVWQALGNTVVYTVFGLATLPLAMVVAALLNRRGLRGVGVYRALYFLPFITLPVSIGLVWTWIYNGDYGLLNQVLDLVGINGRYWSTDPATARYAIGLVIIWQNLGYYLILFIAGIRGIPQHYYEAAELDGANAVQRFVRITVPLLSPTIFFAAVICMINSLQTFDLVYVMVTDANPAQAETQSIVTLFFKWAFEENSQGAAAALAFLLMIVIAALTVAQFRLQKRWVHYA